MGIYLQLSISKSVSKEEWQKVYEETLQLAKAFQLAEERKVLCRDIETACLVPVEEHEMESLWNCMEKRIGWCADGDYTSMRTAEAFYMPKNLVKDDVVEINAGDAMLAAIPFHLRGDGEQKYTHTYKIWGNKTQGEPYHIYLLAIACVIEARLKEKAFVYGDITRGQCRLAVDFANLYLKEPIDLPDRCDMTRLHRRVSKLPLGEKEKINVFENFYLGTIDEEYGEYLRKYDIANYKDLLNYKTDKTINPNLEKALQESFQFYQSMLEDNQYKELLLKSADERCCWLVKQNSNLIFRDCDWEKIFDKIHEKEENFSRYYPMVCVEANTRKLMDIVTAFVLNDKLYEYCRKRLQ